MYNTDEVIANVKKYLQKLDKTINNRSSFTFGKTKIVKKSSIDDILCCVEAALPSEYREHIKKFGSMSLKSNSYLTKIHTAIKNKFILSTDVYAVKFGEIAPLSTLFINELRKDLDKTIPESSL